MLRDAMPAERGKRLSKHWTLGDFLVDSTFPELAVMLDPDEKTTRNLERLANVIEKINEKFPSSWSVLSGFRDQRLNEACRQAGLPASVNSLHLSGCAADIQPSGTELDLEAVFEWVREQSRSDLAVHEAVFYPIKNFIHIGVEDRENPTPKRILMRT
jgi:uncharacterized protein YcbK (DUF882 family)